MFIGCFNLVHYRRLKMTIGFDHHPFVGSKRANAGITTKRKMLYDNGGDAPMNLDGLGDRLKRLRKSHGISQDSLAKAMHVSRSCVRNWETGVRMPSLEDVIKLVVYFQVTSDYLLGLEGNRCIPLDFLSDQTYEAIANAVHLIQVEYDQNKL